MGIYDLPDELKEQVVGLLEGTYGDEGAVAERFGLSLEQAEDIMLEANYERCPECGHWVECWELVDEDLEEVPCLSCRE
ncbi:hypothetical protein [Calidithermus chliarophilus]|uniref:hypothetical protein n=1 Tax=Calidithermus chliarophilus TaxID=52023 RepID=UPI000420E4E9|nr:hypothetical protein [Calidithermus chliarophilus]